MKPTIHLLAPHRIAASILVLLLVCAIGRAQVQIPAHGVINTVAGNGTGGYTGNGGPATSAELDLIAGVAVDHYGDIYVTDTLANRGNVREVTASTDDISTFMDGWEWSCQSAGGTTAYNTELYYPQGANIDSVGNF